MWLPRTTAQRFYTQNMVAAPKLVRLSVREAVDEYLRGVQRAVEGSSLSPATAKNYARDLAEFVDLAGADRVLDDLTAADIDDIVLAYRRRPDQRWARPPEDERGRRGVGAQARFRQSVSRLFSEAMAEGWVEASPIPRTKVRPTAKGLRNVTRRALPEASASALVQTPLTPMTPTSDSAASGTSRVPRADQRMELRDRFLLLLLVEAGPRVGEVCGADLVDLEERQDGTHWLRVLGKGNKERWLPLSQVTWQAAQDYLAVPRPRPRARTRRDPETGELVETVSVEDAERALFVTWRGLRMRPRDVQLLVKRACDALPAQVRRVVTPHGLRHTCATLLLASGAASVSTVRDLLGHESLATTGVYLDSVADELAAAVTLHPVTSRTPRNSDAGVP